MRVGWRSTIGGCLLVAVIGCTPEPPVPPGEQVVRQGVIDVLVDSALFGDILGAQVVGLHYRPGSNDWKVVACFAHRGDGGEEQQSCSDEFEAAPFFNGDWFVSFRRGELYRWTQLSVSEGSR